MNSRLASICLAAVIALSACAGPEPKKDTGGETDPAVANANLGLAYMERGEYQVALTKLKKAIELNPDLPQAHHYIAEVYMNLGNVELADQQFRRAIALDGSNSAIQNNYGIFLCQQGDYKEARRHFERAFDNTAYGQRDEAYENAGLCALRIPDDGKAEYYFRHALEIDPRRPESLYQMALLEYNKGRYLQARAFLERLHDAAHDSPQSLLLAVKVERRLGDEATAATYATRLKKEFPQSKETRSLIQFE